MDRTAGIMPVWGSKNSVLPVAKPAVSSVVPQAKPDQSSFAETVAAVAPPKPVAKPAYNETLEKIETVATDAAKPSYHYQRTAGSNQRAEMTFGDVIDVMNPLHHIPVVASVYRNLTGDDISGAAKIAGGTLYGGPIGAASSIATAMVEEHSGKSIGEHVLSAMRPTPPSIKPTLSGDVAIEAQLAASDSVRSYRFNG